MPPIAKGITSIQINSAIQKNMVNDESISNHITKSDLCPITSSSFIIRKLNTYYPDKKTIAVNDYPRSNITQRDIKNRI